MYTRCPQCQTIFRLTAAQLKARGGQVRCGRCQNVFQADQHLVERPPKTARAPARKRPARKPAAVHSDAAPAAAAAPELTAEYFDHTIPRPAASAIEKYGRYWIAGSVLLVLMLFIQGVVFYGQPAGSRLPALKTPVAALCEYLPCRQLAPIDMQRLDLSETQVAPHPRYDRVLRIKATIINRADHAQPYPLLEVSLIDNQGHLVARRAYPPREYLKKPETASRGLPPHVAVHVSLDITSPGSKASGYEVLLLPPNE